MYVPTRDMFNGREWKLNKRDYGIGVMAEARIYSSYVAYDRSLS